MNYNKIINPETGKKVKIKSNLGIKIIKNYLQEAGALRSGRLYKPIVNSKPKLKKKINYKDKIINFAHKLIVKLDNYLVDCDKNCVKDDKIYNNIEYKIINNSDLETEFLIDVEKKLNYCNNHNYVIKNTLLKQTKIIFSGDYHSSIFALLQFILELKKKNYLDDNFRLIDNYNLVFTGDIVDRGPYGIECLYVIFLLVAINEQDRIIVTKGNHENISVYKRYGFYDELKFSGLSDSLIYKIQIILYKLPMAYFTKKRSDKLWYQFCHGGIDVSMENNTIKNFLLSREKSIILNEKKLEGLGFQWSDFDGLVTNLKGELSNRGANIKKYGIAATTNILKKNNIRTIISGHQDATNFAILPRINKTVNGCLCYDDIYLLDYTGKQYYCNVKKDCSLLLMQPNPIDKKIQKKGEKVTEDYIDYERQLKNYNLNEFYNGDLRRGGLYNPKTNNLNTKNILAIIVSSAIQKIKGGEYWNDNWKISFGILDIDTNFCNIYLPIYNRSLLGFFR